MESDLRANDRFLSLINATSRNSSAFYANECIFSHNEQQKVQLIKTVLAYLEIQVRARNIMMADAQTDYLNDYWTK